MRYAFYCLHIKHAFRQRQTEIFEDEVIKHILIEDQGLNEFYEPVNILISRNKNN